MPWAALPCELVFECKSSRPGQQNWNKSRHYADCGLRYDNKWVPFFINKPYIFLSDKPHLPTWENLHGRRRFCEDVRFVASDTRSATSRVRLKGYWRDDAGCREGKFACRTRRRQPILIVNAIVQIEPNRNGGMHGSKRVS